MTVQGSSSIHQANSALRKARLRSFAFVLASLAFLFFAGSTADARPQPKSGKGSDATPQRFLRQYNSLSNMLFYVTNRGVLFNNDQNPGLLWPRTNGTGYIFGGGLWFATKKVINGKRRKLCELGYNPNSGAGWFAEGEKKNPDDEDGASVDSKYITYFSPRYDRNTGKYIAGSSPNVPPPYYSWPIWDTSATKTLRSNFYFGDYVSNVGNRDALKLKKGDKAALPAILSQEDIVNIYTDVDVTNNPEYKPLQGYPFGLNINEVIYSWSFGRYRDMIFVRHKVTNESSDSLIDCWVAPAFDPDLGTPQNDHNTGVTMEDSVIVRNALKRMLTGNPNGSEAARRDTLRYKRFLDDPSKLNMAYQYSKPEGGKELAVLGFAFLESPAVSPSGEIIENSDSARVGNYAAQLGLNDKGSKQLGLKTMKKWTITNDPSTNDLRYDFVSGGSIERDNGIENDLRLLFATGPFTLPPHKSVETTVGIAIANAGSNSSLQQNIDSCLRLMAFAHTVFADPVLQRVDSNFDENNQFVSLDSVYGASHFLSPEPPNVPLVSTRSLDRAVLVFWDTAVVDTSLRKQRADASVDPISQKTAPFLGYQLFRTTRSDHDSTIRPTGINPVVKLGEWTRFKLLPDSTKGVPNGRFKRTGDTMALPHSYLDLGDDNHDGTITGNEGLLNGVRYYYYVVAFDEYDSLNNVGPLYTAIVAPRNFVSEVPSRPPYLKTDYNLISSVTCSPGIKSVSLDVVDTGRFLQLFTNDEISVSFEPVWDPRRVTEDYNPLFVYVNVTDNRTGLNLTRDKIWPKGPVSDATPFNYFGQLFSQVPGQQSTDSVINGKFTTDQASFQPNQIISQAFRVLVDWSTHQLADPYHITRIDVTGSAAAAEAVHLSHRTYRDTKTMDAGSQKNFEMKSTLPSYIGALGQATYNITFQNPIKLSQTDLYKYVAYGDTTTDARTRLTVLDDASNKATYDPDVLPLKITSETHCDSSLRPIRHLNKQDVEWDFTLEHYISKAKRTGNQDIVDPTYTDPDTMYVPHPGTFAVDAWQYSATDAHDPETASSFVKTEGSVYFPYSAANSSNSKTLLTVHRLRLGGAEVILNYPDIKDLTTTGDSMANNRNGAGIPDGGDFRPGDKITISFDGLAKDLPLPSQVFKIYTPSGESVKYESISNYKDILDQVQVVPNPFVVTHLGQTSTDNSKLFFTRLPPRCTIEIYTLAGDLVKTLEHNGFATRVTDVNTGATAPDYSAIADRGSVEEWNLLSEGRQRVGSQVLLARVIMKDAQNGDAVLGETTVKFGVVLGGFRLR